MIALEIANATEAGQNGRICIEKINGSFLFKEGGTPEESIAGHAMPRAGCGSATPGHT